MNRSEVRRRTMGRLPEVVGLRFERMEFDEVRARDLDEYERENGELYRSGRAGYYLVHRLCDVCSCCGPTPKDEMIFFLVGEVPERDVLLSEAGELDPEIALWLKDQEEYDRRNVDHALRLLDESNLLREGMRQLADSMGIRTVVSFED